MNLDISVDDRDWIAVPNLRKLARRAISAAINDNKVSLSLLFTSDAKILEINRQWRGKASDHQCPVISGFRRNARARRRATAPG